MGKIQRLNLPKLIILYLLWDLIFDLILVCHKLRIWAIDLLNLDVGSINENEDPMSDLQDCSKESTYENNLDTFEMIMLQGSW